MVRRNQPESPSDGEPKMNGSLADLGYVKAHSPPPHPPAFVVHAKAFVFFFDHILDSWVTDDQYKFNNIFVMSAVEVHM